MNFVIISLKVKQTITISPVSVSKTFEDESKPGDFKRSEVLKEKFWLS